jgi:UDP-N-acetylglucosamine 4,6-dehydratase
VVGVSTDKACAPINAYGETKALMEKLFQQACTWSNYTNFTCVRYGNVLGSRGSVLPLFRQQVENDHPITLTDPKMTRFWMTIDQAVQLVLYALNPHDLARGAVLVPMAPAGTMEQLARVVAPDHPTHVIGVRPGEKHYETLVHHGESMHAHRIHTDIGWLFQVLPAYTGYRGDLEPGYEYNSLDAKQLSDDELRTMVEAS